MAPLPPSAHCYMQILVFYLENYRPVEKIQLLQCVVLIEYKKASSVAEVIVYLLVYAT